MTRLGRALIVLAMLASPGCVSSSLVLHVFADGHGRGIITSRLYESSLRAFDAMFAESGAPGAIEAELPPLAGADLERTFGQRVRVESTKLDKVGDGVVRTTVVGFDDITKLRLTFPPLFGIPAGMTADIGVEGLAEPPVVRFAMKPHENGDRLLLVRLPDDRVPPRQDLSRDPDMTVLAPGSREEQLFKRGMKGAALRIAVELDNEIPLLRTNAPAQQGNSATVLELDLEKLAVNLDEDKTRRLMTPGSMQEVIWQIGDMPGATMPVDHEVFLEFEPPRRQQPPPAAAPQATAPQAPPDTEIYLAPLKAVNGALELGTPVNITNSPGYDNQPFFTPDGSAVLFTSNRGGGSGAATTQTDIYRYDLASKRISQVTNTPESEYSPTITPSGALSVIRVELDGNNTQRLWEFTAEGRSPKVLLENVKPVGYHAWADDKTIALFILGGNGQPATLQVADTRSGTARTLATDIGRSLQRMPGSGATRLISFVQRERHGEMVHLTIKQLNAESGAIETLTPAVEGANEADLAWTPDGTLLMVKEGVLYAWKRGQSGWKEVAALQQLGLARVSRLAVSPRGTWIALVAAPPQSR